MSYWDINEFLAEEQNIAVTFKKNAHGFEFLDPQKGFVQYVPEGEPIEIPLWRALTLYAYCQENDLVELCVPKYYSNSSFISYLMAFKQESSPNASKIQSLNLKSKSSYFYEVAAIIEQFFEKEADFPAIKEVADFFNQRANLIITKAISTNEWKELDTHKKRLTNCQYDIHRSAFHKILTYNDWKATKKQDRLVKKKN